MFNLCYKRFKKKKLCKISLIHHSLFIHPREIASTIFKESLNVVYIDQSYINYIVSGILAINPIEEEEELLKEKVNEEKGMWTVKCLQTYNYNL